MPSTRRLKASFMANERLITDLHVWAREDRRSFSNLIEVVLRRAVKEKKERDGNSSEN